MIALKLMISKRFRYLKKMNVLNSKVTNGKLNEMVPGTNET